MWNGESSIYVYFQDKKSLKVYEEHVWMRNQAYRNDGEYTPMNRYARYEKMYDDFDEALNDAMSNIVQKNWRVKKSNLIYVGYKPYSQKYPPYKGE